MLTLVVVIAAFDGVAGKGVSTIPPLMAADVPLSVAAMMCECGNCKESGEGVR